MDVTVDNWKLSKQYYKHDIVRLGGGQAGFNLINRDDGRDVIVFNVITNTGDNLIEESSSEEIIGLEPSSTSDESSPTFSGEINTGSRFKVRHGSGYTGFCYLKKITEGSSTKDKGRTHLRINEQHLVDGGSSNQPNIFEPNESIGVGIGVKFFDKSNKLLLPAMPRKITRLHASQEISYNSFKKIVIDIEKEDVPEDAVQGQMFVCCFGLKEGGFKFKDMNLKYMSDFFYCREDHLSTLENTPDLDDGKFWTQDFYWSPSYGANLNFVSLNEVLKMGDGYDFVNNVSQNSLPLQVEVSFSNRTDREAKAIVHFLQEKLFPYESMFSLDYKGNRLASSNVQSFNFQLFYPYRKNLMFTCIDFQHSITYRNNNDIRATFVCNTESTLRSIEGHRGFDINDDVIIPLSINGTQVFKKDEPKILETYSIDSVGPDYYDSRLDKLLLRNTRGRPSETNEYKFAIVLYFNKPDLLEKLDPYNYILLRSKIPDKTGSVLRNTSDIVNDLDKYFGEYDYLNAEADDLQGIGVDFSEIIRVCFLNNFFDTGFLQLAEKQDYNVYKNTDSVSITFDFDFKNKYDKIISEIKSPIDQEIQRLNLVVREKSENNEDPTQEIKIINFLRYLNSIIRNDANNFRKEIEESRQEAGLAREYESKEGSWISLDFSIDPQYYDKIYLATIPRLPEDCVTSKVYMPEGMDVLSHIIKDENTGLEVKRKILTDDYRVFALERDVHRNDSEILVSVDRDTIIHGPKDFFALVSKARGRSSIYIDFPDQVLENPWFPLRYFEYKSSNTFNLASSPQHINTNFLNYYNKLYKKELNQNLSSFTVEFSQRTDEEAKSILLFLESHLGYKKFIWEPPRPYNGRDLNSLPTERQMVRAFMCPEWSHTVAYKNHNNITATFIESADFENPEPRCIVGVNLFDKINSFSLCTFSSVALTYEQSGFSFDSGSDVYYVDGKPKETDVIFVIDMASMGGQTISLLNGSKQSKLEFFLDALKKSILGYDVDIFPGSNTFDVYNAPPLRTVPGAGDSNRPPWPAINNQKSLLGGGVGDYESSDYLFVQNPDEEADLLDALDEKGYNIENLERFNVKIEEKAINISFVCIGPGGSSVKPFNSGADETRPCELMDQPKCFDRLQLNQSIDVIKNAQKLQSTPNGHLDALCDAMAQFYNSRRASIVTDRFLFFVSDFNFSPIELRGIDSLRENLKSGGKLAKRRPGDYALSLYGKGINFFIRQYGFSDSWREEEITNILFQYSNIYNPDFDPDFGDFRRNKYIQYLMDALYHSFPSWGVNLLAKKATEMYISMINQGQIGADNPPWYEEPLATTFIPVGISATGARSGSRLYTFAEDYVYGKTKDNTSMFYDITNSGSASEEAYRAVSFAKAFESLTEETGAENMYSVTIHNCGPNPIKIVNTIVAFEDGEGKGGRAPWRTGVVTGGLPRGLDIKNIQKVPTRSTQPLPEVGYGGQYYKDKNNQKFLEPVRDDIAWHHFNTRYEIYSNGKIKEIDGGWRLETKSDPIITDDGEEIYIVTEEDVNKDGVALITDPQVIQIHRPITSDLDDFFIDHEGRMVVTDLMTPTPKSNGVLNGGVAFKNFPVRIYRLQSGIEVVDFNIANAVEENGYYGDYEHIPIIESGGSIDLFFGVRFNSRTEHVDNVQLFFHTQDVEDYYMDCYGDFKFQIRC